jgi:primosomal replication protein N
MIWGLMPTVGVVLQVVGFLTRKLQNKTPKTG